MPTARRDYEYAAQVSTPSSIGQDGDILHFMADLSELDALEHQLQHGPSH